MRIGHGVWHSKIDETEDFSRSLYYPLSSVWAFTSAYTFPISFRVIYFEICNA